MRARRGHTLLEVFLAMILVTMVIFAVVSVYPGCMASITKSHQLSNAANLAAHVIEEADNMPFAQLAASPAKQLLPSVTIDSILYQMDESVMPNFNNDPNEVQVIVTVDWNGISSAAYQTVVYNYHNPP